MFVISSLLLGIGLSMDAFSISLIDGLKYNDMKKSKMLLIALIFGFFQALMPLIGWLLVNSIVDRFASFSKFIPFIAFGLLMFIGLKMLAEGIKNKDIDTSKYTLSFGAIIFHGIATSIDALSAGFTISLYSFKEALICVIIIAIVTFILCLLGVQIGKRVGIKYKSKATIIGGVMLLIIGAHVLTQIM